VLVALLSTRQCLKFDDIVQGVIDDNKNSFDDNLAVLEQKVFNETVEVQEWRMRVDAIERQMVEVRADKLEGNYRLMLYKSCIYEYLFF
jgi:hypothetical protein